jgi:DNA polymerase sigma
LDLIKKQQTNSLGSIDFAKNHVILYAEIKPILYILKRLLQERNLNSAFNGKINYKDLLLLILSLNLL